MKIRKINMLCGEIDQVQILTLDSKDNIKKWTILESLRSSCRLDLNVISSVSGGCIGLDRLVGSSRDLSTGTRRFRTHITHDTIITNYKKLQILFQIQMERRILWTWPILPHHLCYFTISSLCVRRALTMHVKPYPLLNLK